MIGELNRAMAEYEISFDCVRNILKQLSKLTGKEYSIINRRVVYRDSLDKHLHDAYVYC